jgi:hypothetical protein
MRSGLGDTTPDIGAVQVIFENGGDILVKKCLMPKEKLPKPQIVRIYL